MRTRHECLSKHGKYMRMTSGQAPVNRPLTRSSKTGSRKSLRGAFLLLRTSYLHGFCWLDRQSTFFTSINQWIYKFYNYVYLCMYACMYVCVMYVIMLISFLPSFLPSIHCPVLTKRGVVQMACPAASMQPTARNILGKTASKSTSSKMLRPASDQPSTCERMIGFSVNLPSLFRLSLSLLNNEDDTNMTKRV